MTRTMMCVLAAAWLTGAGPADAQPARPNVRDRQHVARAQGVPPGQLPPASQCRVWYDDRPAGRQPAPTSCARAEAAAARDRDARVIYGEDTYWESSLRRGGASNREWSDDDDRAVRRGRVRDPRSDGATVDRDDRDGGSVGYRNGYRDGLTKGREDVEKGDRYDVTRHSWYRSATRGYENRHGTRYEYIDRYRAGFEEGYAQGYRVYRRR